MSVGDNSFGPLIQKNYEGQEADEKCGAHRGFYVG